MGVPSQQEMLKELVNAANASPLLESPNPALKVLRNFTPASESVNRGWDELHPDLLASRVVSLPLPLFKAWPRVLTHSRTMADWRGDTTVTSMAAGRLRVHWGRKTSAERLQELKNIKASDEKYKKEGKTVGTRQKKAPATEREEREKGRDG